MDHHYPVAVAAGRSSALELFGFFAAAAVAAVVWELRRRFASAAQE